MAEIKEEKKRGKLTYEQLNNAANQLFAQSKRLAEENAALRKQVENFQASEYFARLDWLWKVIESSNYVVDSDFKYQCYGEFKSLMNVRTASEETSEETSKSTDEDSTEDEEANAEN